MLVKVPLRLSILFYQEKERRFTTGAGLPLTKRVYRPEYGPITIDTRTYGSPHKGAQSQIGTLYEVGHPLGI